MINNNQKKKGLLLWLVGLHFLLFAQPTEFTNYSAEEKELVILEFGYLIDSTNVQPILREENPQVFEFIETRIASLGKDINKEVDGPIKMNFQLEDHYRYGHRIVFSDISVNQPQGLKAMMRGWPQQIRLFKIGKLDSTKVITLEIGPTEEYYTHLNKTPSAADYAIETAFIDSSIKINPNKVFTKKVDAIPPVYPDGMKALNRFLYEEIIAPIKQEKKTSRTLIYFLTIEPDGSISDILPTWNRGTYESDFGLDVINRKMPRWTPAYSNGENVRSLYALVVKIKPYYSQEMINKIINIE